ncbi:hypothetical protein [Chryseobacterium sp. EO14]|uniref:hypothetical protein n=1 Tax=Chryseobacterium sp. EO14 TaxID=2950551 RepID=UPI00210A0A91|nr:hypothetical protein [Chryseobacterium sp. EO14]MCQ4142363.1 hypothetical protein [Chryseobacterium sp. EO14]
MGDYITDICVYKNDCYVSTNKSILKFDGTNYINISTNFENKLKSEIKKIRAIDNYIYTLLSSDELVMYDINKNTKKIFLKEVVDFGTSKNNVLLLKKNGDIILLSKKLIILKKIKTNIVIKEGFSPKIVLYNDDIYVSVPNEGIVKYSLFNKNFSTVFIEFNPTGYHLENFKIMNGRLYFIGLKDVYVLNKNKKFENFSFLKPLNYPNASDFLIIKNHQYYITGRSDIYSVDIKKHQLRLIKKADFDANKLFVLNNSIYYLNRNSIKNICNTSQVFSKKYDRIHDSLIVKRKILKVGEKISFWGYPYTIFYDKNDIKFHKNRSSYYDIVAVDNGYFATTEGDGLQFIDKTYKAKRIKLSSQINHGVGGLLYDHEEEAIFCGDKEYLYYFYLKKPDRLYKIKNPVINGKIICIVKINQRIFVGTEKGLFSYDRKKNIVVTYKNFANHYVGDILLANNTLWVATDKGLYYWIKYNRNIHKVNITQKLRITAILNDKQDRLWCSSYNCILLIDRKNKTYTIFSNKNGLVNSEFNYKAAAKLNDSVLIFGGIQGYDVINTYLINSSLKKAFGKISGIHLIGKDTIFKNFNNQIIHYNKEKYFARIYLSNSDGAENVKTSYQYKINYSPWISVGKRNYFDVLGYNNENDFVIKVKGTDSHGKNVLLPRIYIKTYQAFYKTNAFVFILSIFLILFLFSTIIVMKKNMYVKQKTYSEISMDLHDEIGTILSKSILITKNGSDIEILKEKINENLEYVNRSLREYIKLSSKDKKNILELYDEIREFFIEISGEKNLLSKFTIDYDKNIYIKNNLYKDIKLCIYELANNIIKHSNANHVLINFILVKNKISIEVLTNHKGNYIFIQDNTRGNGLKNIQKRTERNKGEFECFSNDNELTFLITFKA